MSHLPSPAEPPIGFAIRNRALHVLLIVSLSLNVLGLGFLTMHVVRKGGFRYILERLDLKDAKPELLPFQEDWRARLRALPDSEGEIIFLGDSIIAQGPWGEFYSPIKKPGYRRRDDRAGARPARRGHREPAWKDLRPPRDQLPCE